MGAVISLAVVFGGWMLFWAWLGTFREKSRLLDKVMTMEEKRVAATRKGMLSIGKAALWVAKETIKK